MEAEAAATTARAMGHPAAAVALAAVGEGAVTAVAVVATEVAVVGSAEAAAMAADLLAAPVVAATAVLPPCTLLAWVHLHPSTVSTGAPSSACPQFWCCETYQYGLPAGISSPA